MTDKPVQYWFAYSGRSGLGRLNIGIVHWKGFAALFATIMGCGWMLIGGVLGVVFGFTHLQSVILQLGAAIAGSGLVIAAVVIASKAFQMMRKRVDPERTTMDHYRQWFNKDKK